MIRAGHGDLSNSVETVLDNERDGKNKEEELRNEQRGKLRTNTSGPVQNHFWTAVFLVFEPGSRHLLGVNRKMMAANTG